MKTNFLFVCDSVKNDSKLNVEGIFDSVNSTNFPAIHPEMAIVVNIEVPAEEQNKSYVEAFRILLDGKVVVEDSATFNPLKARHQFFHRIQGLLLEKPGRYDVEISVGGKKIGETYFLANSI